MGDYLSKKPRAVDAQLIRGQRVGRLFSGAVSVCHPHIPAAESLHVAAFQSGWASFRAVSP